MVSNCVCYMYWCRDLINICGIYITNYTFTQNECYTSLFEFTGGSSVGAGCIGCNGILRIRVLIWDTLLLATHGK